MSDNKWQKWRADLAALGGWENEMVSVPAGAVREMIVAGEAHYARLARAEAAIREHNAGCQSRCGVGEQEAVACGYRPYFERNGRRCTHCPVYEMIEAGE